MVRLTQEVSTPLATDMKMQGFYLDKDNEIMLEQHSQSAKLSKSEIVRRALKMYLTLHHDEPDTAEAAKNLAINKRVPFAYVITQALYKAIPGKYFKEGGNDK